MLGLAGAGKTVSAANYPWLDLRLKNDPREPLWDEAAIAFQRLCRQLSFSLDTNAADAA